MLRGGIAAETLLLSGRHRFPHEDQAREGLRRRR